jgi:redox-sensing transcriptional repressor
MTVTSLSTIQRLPLYLRALMQISINGQKMTSSEELGRVSGVSPALIRKDLSLFGGFGKQGSGYRIERLRSALTHILHLDTSWEVALVGVGRLGRALLDDPDLCTRGFCIAMLFDNNPALIGQQVNGMVVQDVANVAELLPRHRMRIAILAVPPEAAQPVTNKLVASGVRGILNYTATNVLVPHNVVLRSIDPCHTCSKSRFTYNRSPCGYSVVERIHY